MTNYKSVNLSEETWQLITNAVNLGYGSSKAEIVKKGVQLYLKNILPLLKGQQMAQKLEKELTTIIKDNVEITIKIKGEEK